jgi:hypothetical protein
MRPVLWLVVLVLGCARTFPLCRDEVCVQAELLDSGSARPPRDGGFATQVAYLKSQNTEAGDAFGEALALSGDGRTLAVGAPGEDSRSQLNPFDNRASASGAVSVFTRQHGAWVLQAFLKAVTPRPGDHFGHRLALSRDGNTLVVSAVDESSDATGIDMPRMNSRAPSSGAVFIFTRTGSAWERTATLKASNTGANDAFGAAVSLSAEGPGCRRAPFWRRARALSRWAGARRRKSCRCESRHWCRWRSDRYLEASQWRSPRLRSSARRPGASRVPQAVEHGGW